MPNSQFGLIGLGVMGSNLAKNIAENGFSISVYNRVTEDEKDVVDSFLTDNKDLGQIQGYSELSHFVNSLETPRRIMLMVTAGKVIDLVLDDLIPLLTKGDIVIDGGNSFFKDTIRRSKRLQQHELNFIGCGVSGGAEGARKGPSLMPDGTAQAYSHVQTILESIAAKDKDKKPCCTLVGASGAGHFVKMVHNGIEYAEMQLLAEVYSLLSIGRDKKDLAAIFDSWKTTSNTSFLLEITSTILKKKEGDQYLLDLILDTAKNKGTGSWSSSVALELGYPAEMISGAVNARYISAFKSQRSALAQILNHKTTEDKLDENVLLEAYHFARLINHHQGFELISCAAEEFGWDISLSELSRIWTNGCIIRSELMERCCQIFQESASILNDKNLLIELANLESATKEVIKYGLDARISIPCFSSAYNYFVGMTTERLGANLIQAQRDFFGAHTYQRIDADYDKFFHTNWTNS